MKAYLQTNDLAVQSFREINRQLQLTKGGNMSLTKGQKKIRDIERVLAQTTTDAAEIKKLLQSRFAHSHAYHQLLRRPEIWQTVRPLLGSIYHPEEEGVEALVKNPALTDTELVELGVADRKPLQVLRHEHCGDKTLTVVAKLWHNGRGQDLDCVPEWATAAQIERMYELYPPCREKNSTIGYAEFCQQVAAR